MRRINAIFLILALFLVGCKALDLDHKVADKTVPDMYSDQNDSTNSADLIWREFYKDSFLRNLIDTALAHNQELNILQQEIQIGSFEVDAKKGEYLPKVDLQVGAGLDKPGRYTSRGSSEATTEIEPGRETPDPLPDFMAGAVASWELDIWRKLRNSRDAAISRYLASASGRNFMVTNLISEIAQSYYELLALDNQLAIVQRNIQIQSNALEIVKLQKQASKVTEIAVRRFEAQVFNTKALQFNIKQQIVLTENRINFLLGRFPQPVQRSAISMVDLTPDTIQAGVPSQLLLNRPDIQQSELELMAADLDIKVARANFYPSLGLSAGVGFQAFNPAYLVKTPESLMYSLAGDLIAPLVNRRAIKATYFTANAKQIQAIYSYERTILNAYIDVINDLSRSDNLANQYAMKSQEVKALNKSVDISIELFQSARADYMEVLLTQRDALEAKFELIETRLNQMKTQVMLYRDLGGGWK